MTESMLETLRRDPGRCAILMDVDGTLAPIVERAEDARVPADASAILRELAGVYGVVACVTGRRALDARRMVGVAEIAYLGNQGFETLAPGAEEPRMDPAVEPRRHAAGDFLDGIDWAGPAELGLRREDKGPVQVVHWRGAPDEAAAESAARELEQAARAAGLVPMWGRKVLELRPVSGIDKGTAVRRLLEANAPLAAALFAGDDRTDLDAFRALADLAGGPILGAAVRVGVDSPESPPEIAAQADLVVAGTPGVLEILRALRPG